MQWNSDPKNQWVAIYRVIVIVLLIVQMLLMRHGHSDIETEVKGVQATAGATR